MLNSTATLLSQVQRFFGWPRPAGELFPGAALRETDCRQPSRCDAGQQPQYAPDGAFPSDACRSCKLRWLGGAFVAECRDEPQPLAALVALDELTAMMFRVDEPEIAYWLSGVRYFVEFGGDDPRR